MSIHYRTHHAIARGLSTTDLMRSISTLRRRVTQARRAANGPAMVALLDELEVYNKEFRRRTS